MKDFKTQICISLRSADQEHGSQFFDHSSFILNWWRIRDLNPGPTDYDSAALTTELIRHLLKRKGSIVPSRGWVVKIKNVT